MVILLRLAMETQPILYAKVLQTLVALMDILPPPS